jgi:hypothetical protein
MAGVRLVIFVFGVLLALAEPAGACCLGGCAVRCPPPPAATALLLPPVTPSFHVEQGPTFKAVLIDEGDVERRLEFAHPQWYPYVGGRRNGRQR